MQTLFWASNLDDWLDFWSRLIQVGTFALLLGQLLKLRYFLSVGGTEGHPARCEKVGSFNRKYVQNLHIFI